MDIGVGIQNCRLAMKGEGVSLYDTFSKQVLDRREKEPKCTMLSTTISLSKTTDIRKKYIMNKYVFRGYCVFI